MQARVGDRLCVHGRVVGQADHRVEIVEVRGADGAPPYLVRYPDGHEAVLFPGPDAVVEPASGQPGDTGAGLGAGGTTSFEPEEDAPAAGGRASG